MTLTEIRRRVRPGQVYEVTNHRLGPEFSPVTAVVDRMAGDYGFYLRHALGETKVGWPPARFVTRDEDGTLHLLGTGAYAGLPFLTLVPAPAAAAQADAAATAWAED
jgi:hypothetical protein